MDNLNKPHNTPEDNPVSQNEMGKALGEEPDDGEDNTNQSTQGPVVVDSQEGESVHIKFVNGQEVHLVSHIHDVDHLVNLALGIFEHQEQKKGNKKMEYV